LWNVKEKACIHAFNPRYGDIRALFFAGGADISCTAVANFGSIIRLWRAEGSSDFAWENIGEAAPEGGPYRAAFSPCGSFLATIKNSSTENASTLRLYELDTMTKTQPVVVPGMRAACLAFSEDNKQLVVGGHMGRIRLLQSDDFTIQRDLSTRGGSSNTAVVSVAFDPTCRVLAFGCRGGTLELRTL
jgi:WD40 repeat protein